jgi:ribosomal protein S27AE
MEYRSEYPNKYKAHSMVGNAIQRGQLFKEPCCKCGSSESIHAHHDDYLKPMNVRWMCAGCHSQWHKLNGEGLNAR